MVYVLPGVYRERVSPARTGEIEKPIIYQAAPGHQVFVRGSEVWNPAWQPVEGETGVFTATLDEKLFPGANPYKTAIVIAARPEKFAARPITALNDKAVEWLKEKEEGRMPRTLGQLFVDGAPMHEAETITAVYRSPGTWIVNPEGTGLIVHFFPSSVALKDRLVELTVRDRIFAPKRRGLENIIVRGFVFEHAANQGPFPQQGAVSLRSGGRWIVEDNIIRFAKTIGLDAGGEAYRMEALGEEENPADRKIIVKAGNIIRNNTIADNGLSGLAAWNCPRVQIVGNRVERNNALGFRPRGDFFDGWEEHAGIKLHNATDGLIENNFVANNDGSGIWIDNGFTNARITRNTVLGNAGAGIMLELGNGPCLVDQNVVAFTRYYSAYYAGDGIYGHDASGLIVAHNLSFANARYGIFFQRITNRKIGLNLVEASNLRILNNLLFDNQRGPISLPADGERNKGNFSDGNVFGGRMQWLTANSGEDNPFLSPVTDKFRAFKLTGKPKSPADGKGWGLNDGMTLEDWQQFTGWDKNSILSNPRRLIVREMTKEIEIQLGEGSGRLEVSPVDGAWTFKGDPLPSEKVIAGPWQSLSLKNERFFLWPVKPL